MRKTCKFIHLIMIFTLGIMSALLTGCNTEEEQEVVFEALRVETKKPESMSIVNNSSFMGSVTTQDTVTITAKASGEVTEKFFDEGDYVSAGDLLFKIDDTQARQGVATAEAAYQSTKSSVDKMLGSGLDSQTIATASAYKTSEISLDTAQYSLDDLCAKIGDCNSKISDIEDDMDDVESAIDDLEDAAEGLSALIEAAKQNPGEGTEELIKGYQSQLAVVENGLAAQNQALAQLESAKAQQEATRNQYDSQVHIYQNNVKTAQVGMDTNTANVQVFMTKGLNETLATASTTLNQAQVSVNNARQSLDYYSVKTPVSGKIMSCNVEQYGMASPGSSYYVILPDETKKVTFYVSESNINNLYIGQPVSVEYSGNIFNASISEIKDEIDPATGMFKVDATFEGIQSGLYVGSSVKITLETARADSTLAIPLDAVYYENETPYVYANDNGTAKKVYIQTGLYDDNNIQVLAGIDNNTDVITTWSAKLKDGEKVNGIN